MPKLNRLLRQRLPEPGPGELESPTSGGSGDGSEIGQSPIQPWWLWLSAMARAPLCAPGRDEGSRP
jgi:hypothetical protein